MPVHRAPAGGTGAMTALLALRRQASPPARVIGAAAAPPIVDLATVGASLLTEWRELAESAVEPNPFFQSGFLLPAANALLPRERLEIAAPRISGQLAGLSPIVNTMVGGVVQSRLVWVHDYAPLGVPLLARNRSEEAAVALLSAAAPDCPLVVPDLTLDGNAAEALRAAAHFRGRAFDIVGVHRRAALIPQPGGAADLRASLASRRRKEYARQMRRLSDLGDVTVDAASTATAVAEAFEEFLVLERAGWKGKKGTAIAVKPQIETFAREAVASMARTGACQAMALRIDRRPIAIAVSFVHGDLLCTWKIAHDPEFERFSPGAQLMLELGNHSQRSRSLCRADSLAAPDHPMIDHLWRDRLAIGTVVIGPPRRSALYRLGLASERLQRRARDRMKTLVHHLRRRP